MATIDLGNGSQPARFHEKLPDNDVRCHLCPHNCLVHEGKAGICKTRVNHHGDLYCMAYGNPCSISVDPIEKKPLFHFFPGSDIYSIATAGCNFRCLNCQNWQISQISPHDLQHYSFTPDKIVQQAEQYDTKMIAFTYTEPTVFYEYMYDTAKIAHQRGLQTVLVSNGYINEEPLIELSEYLDAANIDLKCFDDKLYRELTSGGLQPVLDTLKILKATGVWVEITNLIIPTYSDNEEMIYAMCKWLVKNGFEDTPLHFSRFFPAYKLPDLPPTTDDMLFNAKKIAEQTGIKYVYIGNRPSMQEENTYCPKCNQSLVERIGFDLENNFIVKGHCPNCNESIAGVWN